MRCVVAGVFACFVAAVLGQQPSRQAVAPVAQVPSANSGINLTLPVSERESQIRSRLRELQSVFGKCEEAEQSELILKEMRSLLDEQFDILSSLDGRQLAELELTLSRLRTVSARRIERKAQLIEAQLSELSHEGLGVAFSPPTVNLIRGYGGNSTQVTGARRGKE